MALKQRFSLFALALIAALVAAHFGCDPAPRTQIVVVVDSDFDIPDGLDTIVIDASAPDEQDRSSSIELEGPSSLPATVTLVHEGGPLGPFTVEASGEREGSTIVERQAEVSFVPDRSLVLTMHLVESCSGFPCPAFETCGEEGCVDPERDDLPEWNGTPPRLDGGDGDADVDGDVDSDVDGDVDSDVDGDGDVDADVDGDVDADADACVPTDEVCNGEDDDCDDEVDEDFDLDTDVDNCGSCGFACDFQNGTGECRGGECVVLSCDTDFDNCNDDDTDGCETDLTADADNCGSCGVQCTHPVRNTCCFSECRRPENC